MSLVDRLLKISKSNVHSSILSKKEERGYVCKSSIPAINIALSGDLNGGLDSGIFQIVGDSRCFKSCYGLSLMADFLNQNDDSYALFFDSEHGAGFEYFDMFNIDRDRVIHLPIENIEDLKIQCANYLKELTKDDKVFFFIDSIGLLPSIKEADDAVDGKIVADMTRARSLNSFFRVVSNPLVLKNIPMVIINHYYDTMAMFPEQIIKGGKNALLASNTIWIVTRSKIKEDKELSGWSFNIRVLKSRRVKENVKLSIDVLYQGGIDKTSGLLDIAKKSGHVDASKKGWYSKKSDANKSFRKTDLTFDWWTDILCDESFGDFVKSNYKLSGNNDCFIDVVNGDDTDDADGDV